ncbi:siderophore ABC transporter substrate-binding protein [Tomitella biformata]|uniref:siderophore ABC transporter substrate-binding protein n=1 Tax=Tomitella biformata TaxID=630403 RepID=UPI000464BF60|nr:siderophore ABC transporter substrate-binding protein [Tomitella biformata]
MRRTPASRRWLTALIAPVVLGLAACGTSDAGSADDKSAGAEIETVSITHAQGSQTFDRVPSKVLVFDSGALVTLNDLGVEIAGVPELNSLPENLSKFGTDQYEKVGTLKEPDFEKVNALAPDLIIIGGRSATAYDELSKIAPTIDVTVDNGDFLASFRDRTESLGKIFDKQDEVAQRLDALDVQSETVAALAAERDETGLIVLTTGGKISAYGPGSRFGIIHDPLGVQPASANLSVETHGDSISSEFIAESNPDILYVVDRDAAIGEEGKAAGSVLDNDLVDRTSAAKNGRIVFLDPFTWYIAPTGLSSVEAMVQTVGDSLQ